MNNPFTDPYFLAFFNHPDLGAAVLDKHKNFFKINNKFSQMIGYSENEIIGKSYLDVTYNEGLNQSQTTHNRSIESTIKSTQYEKRLIKKNNDLFWAKITITVIDEYTIAIIEDITERKIATEEARFKEMQLEIVFNNANIGLCCVDESLKVVFSNPALSNMLGYSEIELKSLTLKEITHPEDLLDMQNRLNKNNFNNNYQVIRRYRKKDNSYIFVSLAVSKFPVNIFNLYGLAVIEDISKQKESEKKIEHQQAQLVNSSKMAALGEMAAGIAHEINNPLTIILGNTLKIRKIVNERKSLDKDLEEKLFKIEMTTKRIAKIINSLRSFSRNGENDQKENVSLKTVIESTLDLCEEKLKSLDIKIKLSITDEIEINCNPIQVSQVFLNLISNSSDAIENHPDKWIKVTTELKEKFVEIRFTDSGYGIPVEIRQKMLNPFFTTKEIGKGTGLGLSLSMNIINEHNGKLFYDENTGHTTFVVALPTSSS